MSLHDAIEGYIAFRLALGFRMKTEASILRAFSRSAGAIEATQVKPQTALAFIAGRGPLTRSWEGRATPLRGFYRYALARQFVTRSPVPTETPKLPPLRIPYIYSTAELKRLLAATHVLHYHRSPLRTECFHTLLLLLYSTGLRLNEALALTLNDVDLKQRLVTVRGTKFHKTRWVPTGPKLTQVLAHYARQRRAGLPMPTGNDSAFFATVTGRRWHCVLAAFLFRRLRAKAEIFRQGNKRNQPCLHDLRHTCAQHHLLAWYRSGRDLHYLLARLATYLGHLDIRSTQHYLSMTPELLHEANRRFEHYAQTENAHA